MRNAAPTVEMGKNFTQVHIFRKTREYIKVYTKIRNPTKENPVVMTTGSSGAPFLGEDGLIRKRVENRLIHTHKLNCDVRASAAVVVVVFAAGRRVGFLIHEAYK